MTVEALRGHGTGVRAQQGASTPVSFPPVADDDTLATLEFAAALDLVAGCAAGPLGATRVRARRPLADPAATAHELAAVGEVLALLRRGDDLAIPPVPELGTLLGRLRLEGTVLDTGDLLAVRRTVAAARVVGRELRRVADEAPRAAQLAAELPPPAVDRRLAESIDEENGELLDTASPALAAARREAQVARDRLVQRLEGLLRGLDPQVAPPGAAVTVRGGRYVIPVRRDSRARPDGIVHDESGSAGTLFLEPTAAIGLGNALRAAQADEQREALRVLRELTELLRPLHAVLAGAHEMCVVADDLVARARYAHLAGGEVPVMAEPDEALVLRQARHPLLLARLPSVVPFDLALAPGQRTLLVTGPNTGGKTVLLKTIGVTALLAQSGVVGPTGTGSRLPVFTRIVADIGDRQSIAADLSTFSAHVGLLKGVIDDAGPGTLVLLDEIGGGTDPVEGGALAAAVLRALTERGAVTVATTHLGALKTLPEELPAIVNGSLHFDTATLAPTFQFRIGVPGRSYGLAIAQRLGMAPGVLADAEARVPRAERDLDRLLAGAEARLRELEERLAGLEEREADAAMLAAALDGRSEEVARREATLRDRERTAERRAREEAREILRLARGQVEEALRTAAGAAREAEAKEARRLVEEAIRAESAVIAGLIDAPVLGGGGPVAVGERVRTAAGAIGTVRELRPDGRLVVVAGAMRLVVPRDQVERVAAPAGGGEHRRTAAPPTTVAPPAAPLEIDLRGLRVDEAEATTIAALDAAVLGELPYLRIIHGMGTGAVRDRVQQVLRGDRRVARFGFAAPNQGGTGVTIAEFAGS